MLAGVMPRRSLISLLIREPLRFHDRFRSPLAVLMFGAFVDGFTTYQFLHEMGPMAEVHPIQRLVFMYAAPIPGVLLAKGGQVLLAILVAAWWEPWCKWLLYVTGILYILAALSNHYGWL